MKTMIIIFTLIAFTLVEVQAQNKLTEKDVTGSWRLVIDVSEEMDELRDEMDDTESLFGQVIKKSVSGFVEGLLNNIEIYMDFLPNGEVEVTSIAFDKEDRDFSTWKIVGNKLYISDSDNFQVENDSYWIMEHNSILISVSEDGNNNKNVYLRKIE
jgi:hypothetical protein